MSDKGIEKSWDGTWRATLGAVLATCLLATAAPAAMKVTEKAVTVTTPDGTAEAALFYPEGKGVWPEVILWPDFVGLRQSVRDLGREYAAAGFVVLVPNTFYRGMRPSEDELNPWDPKVRPTLMKYREAATNGIAIDAPAYVAFLDAQKHAAKGKVGAIGYDLGGSYAFRAAAVLPDRIAAVASIYGLGVATEHPDSPHLLVPKTKASYYVAQAADDDKREPGDKTDIANAINGAGLNGTVEVYPANHGFANPKSKAYDAAAADRAFGAVVKLLKSTLE